MVQVLPAVLLALSATLLWHTVTTQPASAADAKPSSGAGPHRIMVVVDSSGSMWGQIEGRIKRDIVRSALRGLARAIPEDADAGLIAYGHRRRGDCEDIEVILVPTAAGANQIDASLRRLTPVGKTPLTAAVRRAAEELRIEKNRSTVILVTDGIETCDANPCALGDALEASGIDFTAHVVGFGLSPREGRQVACLAEETGGHYLEAANADQLNLAMEEIAVAVREAPEKEESLSLPAATLSGPAEAEAGSVFQVDWHGPGARNDYIDLVPLGHEKTSGELSYAFVKDGAPLDVRVSGATGDHLLRYVWVGPKGREVLAETPIRIVEAEVAIIAPAGVGIGETFKMGWRGPGGRMDYIDIVERGEEETGDELSYVYVKEGPILELTAPGTPGSYDLRYILDTSDGPEVIRTVPIEIEDVGIELSFKPEVSLAEQFSVAWKGPGARLDYIDIVPRGHEKLKGELSYAYLRDGNPVEMQLPAQAGEYDLRYVLSAADGPVVLAVAPLKITEVEIRLDFPPQTSVGETIAVGWAGPGTRLDYIDIVPRGHEKVRGEISLAYLRSGNPVELQMPAEAGAYDLRYVMNGSDGRAIKAVKPLEVAEAVADLTFEGRLIAGGELSVTWQGPGSYYDYLDIVPEGTTKTRGQITQVRTNSGNPVLLELPEAPGTYDLRYVLAGPDKNVVKARRTITVE